MAGLSAADRLLAIVLLIKDALPNRTDRLKLEVIVK